MAPEAELTTSLANGAVVKGDNDLIRHVVQNLVTNAMRYNDHNGFINLKLEVDQKWVTLDVSNGGEGIPVDAQDHIFDRFYRGSRSRDRKKDGFGLGLSLAREISRVHGGELSLVQSDSKSTTFRLTLPVKTTQVPGDPQSVSMSD